MTSLATAISLQLCIALLATDTTTRPAVEPPTPASIRLSDDYDAALKRGDSATACRLLADHFATRPRPPLPAELFIHAGDERFAHAIYLTDRPEFVLKNKFAFLAEYVETGPTIKWNTRFCRNEAEPTWWINRFLFLGCLLDEYDRSKRREYPRHGIDLMLDWIHKNPVEQARDLWASWRGLEIGLRLSSWAAFVSEAAARRLFEPHELAAILESMRVQADYLRTISGPHRGNHGFMEQCGIAGVALLFPEFRDSGKWLQGVLTVYQDDVASQIYPDGSQEEMTPHYAYTVMWSLARLVYLMKQRHEPVPASIIDALRRSTTYLALIQKPDHTLPMFNDGDAIDIQHVLRLVATMLALDDVKCVLEPTGRTDQAPPLCRMFTHSGVAVMRDSWNADARCLLMDAGPFGTGHQHEDALGLDVSAFGRSFIVDPGRFTYAGGPMMEYFQGTRSHATVMVDGSGQTRRQHPDTWRAARPLSGQFVADDHLALAVGDYTTGYADPKAVGVVHRREVLFVDHRYWVVSDVLLGAGRHHIELNFQFTPGELKMRDGMATTQFSDANLALLWNWPAPPTAQLRTGRKEPPLGWYSPCYWRVMPAPHLCLAADLDLPARLMLVLYPFKGASSPALALARADRPPVDHPETCGTIRLTCDDQIVTVAMRDPRTPASAPNCADLPANACASVTSPNRTLLLRRPRITTAPPSTGPP